MKKHCFIFTAFILSLSIQAQKVGINVTTPVESLHVDSTIKIGKDQFLSPSTPGRKNLLKFGDSDFVTIGEEQGDDKLYMRYGNLVFVPNNSSGKIGIATETPTALLDINGALRIRSTAAAAGKVLTSDTAGNATWQVVPTLTLPYTSTVSATNSVQFYVNNTASSSVGGLFANSSTSSSESALRAVNSGSGIALEALNFGTGISGTFYNTNTANTQPALQGATSGSGPAVLSYLSNTTANTNHILCQTGGANVARIDKNGKGYFNGGVQSSGADVAETFAVEGARQAYEPGDVLIISTTADRTVAKSNAPYSTLVAGVYATKPGVLLTERLEGDSQADLVPMGVVGVIPTKVCLEGGAIHRGDLLVTSSTPGHAMKGDEARLKMGTVIGKALEDFTVGNSGLIKVLVNVR